MTAASATPRIPTPGDLARRGPAAPPPARPTAPASSKAAVPGERPASAADAIRSGRLRQSELMRQMYQRGIRASRMLPEARLVALTLLQYAHYRTGLCTKREPSLEELAYATGLTTGQARVQLEVLTSRGWLTQRKVTTGPRIGRLTYQLCIPQLVLERLRNRTDAAPTS